MNRQKITTRLAASRRQAEPREMLTRGQSPCEHDTFKTWEDVIEYFSRLGGQ